MDNIKYLYKDAFAVIGKAGQGPADNPQDWILPLWNNANACFAEVVDIIRKEESGMPLIWGAMNDENESNKRWGNIGKYMASGEADIDVKAPDGWTKWIIPAQTYMVAKCTMDEYGEVFGKITNDPKIQIVGTVHERYPEPGNPNVVEIYFPISEGKMFCQSCYMPMTKPMDFGTEADKSSSRDYCHHCYDDGMLLKDITMDKLTTDVQKLIDIENRHPDLLSTPLLNKIKEWLALESDSAKTAAISALLAKLIDGQDCDYMGTRWEKEWLADGKVCHCIACIAARKCISDIKLMGTKY